MVLRLPEKSISARPPDVMMVMVDPEMHGPKEVLDVLASGMTVLDELCSAGEKVTAPDGVMAILFEVVPVASTIWRPPLLTVKLDVKKFAALNVCVALRMPMPLRWLASPKNAEAVTLDSLLM